MDILVRTSEEVHPNRNLDPNYGQQEGITFLYSASARTHRSIGPHTTKKCASQVVRTSVCEGLEGCSDSGGGCSFFDYCKMSGMGVQVTPDHFASGCIGNAGCARMWLIGPERK